MIRCPHCTAPVGPEETLSFPACFRCSASLRVEPVTNTTIRIISETPSETRDVTADLQHLAPLALRQITARDLSEVPISSCPSCAFPLRLHHLGSGFPEKGGIRLSFPQAEDQTFHCEYCGSDIPWKGRAPGTLDIQISAPAPSSKAYDIEQFLNEKPVHNQTERSGGCFSQTLLLGILILAWIL
ncbi:MAG TPA: hypothetical protein PK014_06145 [Thermoanaerobaculia bacterium]|nr:hypothetical protein [Thermoanaerobaculia bacterium]HUM29334.1 hypothetical protein [Thermoanaerobaculia bacterium]HXK67580.1 hypothetical protein [Thermoanaerobaculia bacterium]